MIGTSSLPSQSPSRKYIPPCSYARCAFHTNLSSVFAPGIGGNAMHRCMVSMVCVMCLRSTQVRCRPGSPPASGVLHHQVPCLQLYKEVMHCHMISIVYLTYSPVPPSTALDLSPEYPTYGIHNTMEDQMFWMHNLQHTGSDVCTQAPATDPVPNPYEVSQAPSRAAVQTQPHVASAQGSTPMDAKESPQGSGVEQQPPIPRDHTGVLNSAGDFANPSAGSTAQGVSREKCGDEWTGILYLNGVCAHARAQASETVHDPYGQSFVKRLRVLHPRRMISAWPKHLQLEPVFDSQVNNLNIQGWMHDTKAPVVRLSGIDEKDEHFGQLIETLRRGRGVSRPSFWLFILAVSRFDSTQL
jgi:hypothetical protein